MNIADEQIKSSYEIGKMSPEEIAEDQDLAVVAVKAKLMQVSSKYRSDCKLEPSDQAHLNFTDDQLAQVNDVILTCALAAETPDGAVDYRTRLTAAMYIRDDKKGRKEVQKALNGANFNILNINESLMTARVGAQQARAMLDNMKKVA